MPTVRTATATIAAGESVSSSVDLTGASVAQIVMPSQWTPANISLLASFDNVNFNRVVDRIGKEIQLPAIAATAMPVNPDASAAAMYLKIMSGSSVAPVAQEAQRVVTLILI